MRQTQISLLFLFFFHLISLSVYSEDKAMIVINIQDCREVDNGTYLSEIKILRNGEEYQIVQPETQNEYIIKDLELGIYTLLYTSFFGKEESKEVKISTYKKYDIVLCLDFMDYSKETYKSLIDQLKNNESYTINLLSRGCFHSVEEVVTINRKKDIYTIQWDLTFKSLNKKDIEAIRHFEIELNYQEDKGCTTEDIYTLNYKGNTKKIIDASCSWEGLSYLHKQIFGTKK